MCKTVLQNTTYWYKLSDTDYAGTRTFHEPITITVSAGQLPDRFLLRQNFPNPFNPSTTLSFDIPETNTPQIRLRLSIYNSKGQLVRRLYDGYSPAGSFNMEWNGSFENGSPVASGINYARMAADQYTKTIKMVLLK